MPWGEQTQGKHTELQKAVNWRYIPKMFIKLLWKAKVKNASQNFEDLENSHKLGMVWKQQDKDFPCDVVQL